LAVSDVLSNAANAAQDRPYLAVGVVGGLGVLVYLARRNRGGDDEAGPALGAPAEMNAAPGDGLGFTPIPPITPAPSGTPKTPGPAPEPSTQPGPIKGPSLRITDADRAAYMCDQGSYLRYGRGANAGKIVCVNRATRKEGKVILRGDGRQAH